MKTTITKTASSHLINSEKSVQFESNSPIIESIIETIVEPIIFKC